MTDEVIANNGSADTFSIGAILDIVAPFEFPFEGHVLKGKWYKYKTSTRDYIKARITERDEQRTRLRALREELTTVLPSDARLAEIMAECQRLEEEGQRTNHSWLTDAIIEWNAVGRDGQPLPLTAAAFSEIPVPFLEALDRFLSDSRTDKNPTSSGS